MALILTDSGGIRYGVAGNLPEAEAAFKAGYMHVAPGMLVSTSGARIDILPDAK